MNKETQKKLIKDFPKNVINKAPQGKFGDYISHGIITKRLVDVAPDYNFTYEVLRDKDNAIVGAKCRLEIPGLGIKEDVGDVDVHAIKRNLTESELLKLAVSDGIKRCAMRFGLGLDQLWNGGVTEEEHYSAPQPIQKTGTVKDQVIEKEDTLAKAKQEFANDVAADPTNKQELAKFMNATIKDKDKREKLKKKVYDDVVSKGFPKDINEWDKSQVEIYKDEVFNANEDKSPDTALAEEILGAEVTHTGPPNDENKVCPGCSNKGDVCDNRDKKASNPKMAKIPDFACQKAPYGNGCGWATWVGNADCPEEWI
jgi:hypothetical protein